MDWGVLESPRVVIRNIKILSISVTIVIGVVRVIHVGVLAKPHEYIIVLNNTMQMDMIPVNN